MTARVLDAVPGARLSLEEDGARGLVEVWRIRPGLASASDVAAIVARVRRAGPAFTRALDHGRHADGAPYITLEHVPRLPLRRLIDAEARRGIAPPMALALVRALASSLAAAEVPHGSAGLDCAAVDVEGAARLHYRPRLWVLRGGRGDDVDERNLDTLAPELVKTSRHASAAADVFTLGALLFALIAGRSPFLRSDPQSTRGALDTPAPLLVHDGAPAELAHVIDRMTRREPDERMPLADVAAALDHAAPWARWTNARVAAELRAMVPDELARLTVRGAS